jgi:cation diffusion facilitator family transporter
LAESHGSVRAILYALGANAGIAVAKTAAAIYTHSGAMMAEAIHSAADSANQLLLLIGLKRARRPVSAEHPLGYGKAIFFWSFIVALLLFSLGGMFSIYEGIHKLRQPEMPNQPWVAVAVLVVAIALEGISLRTALLEVSRVRGRRSFLRWFRSSRQSELVVVVGEDIAALAGLLLALAAVLATIVTGNPFYDALGTIAIGAVLILVAIALGVEVKSLLIGESAEPETLAAMRVFLKGRPEITKVFRLITLQLGTEIMVTIKARMREKVSAARLIRDINKVERELRKAFPEIRWVFFEPDTKD